MPITFFYGSAAPEKGMYLPPDSICTYVEEKLCVCTYIPISTLILCLPNLVSECQPIKRTMNDFLGFVFHCSVSESYKSTSKIFTVTCNNFSCLNYSVNDCGLIFSLHENEIFSKCFCPY